MAQTVTVEIGMVSGHKATLIFDAKQWIDQCNKPNRFTGWIIVGTNGQPADFGYNWAHVERFKVLNYAEIDWDA